MTGMILCPTRGGSASYPNQDWAIDLAKKRGVDLLFLYVSNVQFLSLTARAKVVDIETELDEMGDFLLTMAQERAALAGVEAQTLVRRGVFHDVLEDVIEAYPVATIVMGSSEKGAGLVSGEYLRELGETLSAKTALEFIVLHEGEVACTFPEE